MSNCQNCYNGCVETTSDQCVKYTGVDIPELGIVKGDPLSLVLLQITNAINESSAFTPPYKVYTALLTQVGTSAPTAIVLENTLGGTITWAYVGVGIYSATLTGAFTIAKTIGFSNIGIPFAINSQEEIRFQYSSTSTVIITTLHNSVLTNTVMNNATIEIRVYN